MGREARTDGSRRPRSEIPPDAPEADALEQAQPWDQDEREIVPRVPPDAPEADALEQAQPWEGDEEGAAPRIRSDAPEGDAVDQTRPADPGAPERDED